ncbi:HlyD family secretion protein [Paucidesulfovibrio gracilis DSM 16080]|uniref:HlyD family secretion protein n=1 Tax=Paucidesulfovibrio gracilis DSM 16080 TaxID=1121449 RepID=A0A1T4X924_9BACT|nr:efflux RND transporter periplasmic adaptor subunit [Paucidesulfovibrio gracilis]SKA85401.1 HlyD family secretion protein [Paucidesulfovibrio gracilis DSM 16080]
MKKFILLGLILAVVAGVLIWRSSGTQREITVLQTASVEQGEVRHLLEATGIVKAQVGAQVKIGARATGVLVDIPVKVGDEVEAGQLVAEIDDREIRAKLAEAQARARLADAKAVRAAKDLERKKRLVSQKLEPQSSLDEALEDARVTRYESQAAAAALESLRVQLSYYRIFSPIHGVVSNITAQEGETVVSGLQVSNLITVLDPTRLEMWIYVDETDVGRTHPGQDVEFFVDAYPDRAFTGKVKLVYPEPEIRDNIVYYRALVDVIFDPEHPLRPEMTTQCRIVVERRENVPTMPNEAVKWVNGEQAVFVLRGGVPERVDVELGLRGLERSEVRSGLNVGDEVVTQLVLPDVGAGAR